MAGDGLHSRVESAVSVRQTRAVFIFRIDPVTRAKRLGATSKIRQSEAARLLASRFPKPHGCNALSVTRTDIPRVLSCARSDLQHLHIVSTVALHCSHSRGRGRGGEISFVSTAANHC